MGKDRILVVDDDPDNRAMIGHFLTNWGYDVDDAKNGKVALEKVLKQAPSLVLLDLEMPEMDGFETCERLKTNPETEWIPVILFTGLEKMPHRIRGFRHGADDYVVKTVEPDELRTRIELVLKRTKRYTALASAPAPEPETKAPDEEEDAAVSVSLSRIPFPEAMRLVLAHGKSGIVRISGADRAGSVHIEDGHVVHAAIEGNEVGEDAFYELALWRKGRFEFQDGEPGADRTIRTPTRSLFTEASRRHDAWSMISSKVPSFDYVPKWIPLAAQSIRLTKSDWAIARVVDGQRSIRDIVELLRTDIFEAGRVVFSLITVGVLKLDPKPETVEEVFDLIPQRGESLHTTEPFELTAAEWAVLAKVDGKRNLGTIRETLNVAPAQFMKVVRGLKDKGFLRLLGRERKRMHA